MLIGIIFKNPPLANAVKLDYPDLHVVLPVGLHVPLGLLGAFSPEVAVAAAVHHGRAHLERGVKLSLQIYEERVGGLAMIIFSLRKIFFKSKTKATMIKPSKMGIFFHNPLPLVPDTHNIE